MTVRFKCSCGQKLAVKDGMSGRKVRCPRCKGVQVAPQPLLSHSEITRIDDDEAPTKIMDAMGPQSPASPPARKPAP